MIDKLDALGGELPDDTQRHTTGFPEALARLEVVAAKPRIVMEDRPIMVAVFLDDLKLLMSEYRGIAQYDPR